MVASAASSSTTSTSGLVEPAIPSAMRPSRVLPAAGATLATRPRHGGGRGVALWPILRQVGAPQRVVHRLGDVGGVVADALQVLRHEQQVGGGGNVARVLH